MHHLSLKWNLKEPNKKKYNHCFILWKKLWIKKKIVSKAIKAQAKRKLIQQEEHLQIPLLQLLIVILKL